ncbi:acyl-CoA dehydrogenase family protein [Streptomyces sp. NPDC004830]
MGVAIAPADPAPTPERTGPGRAHWLRVAREVADDLATDAVAREQAGKDPLAEVAALREAGLLTLLAPVEFGGGGADWATACAVIREIAAADGAIGQLLGCHYFLSWSTRFFSPPGLAARVHLRSAAEQWCWGGGLARQGAPALLTGKPGRQVLDGRQSYTTGVLVADRLAVRAVRAGTDEPVAVLVDPAGPGVRVDGDTGGFGQRLAAGGSVEFDGVPVTGDDVLGPLPADEESLSPAAALASPAGRLVSVGLLLGMTEGVLAEVREYSRTGHTPWPPASQVPTPADPQVLGVYGELTVLTRSAAALADQALDAVREGLSAGDDVGFEQCAEISVLVAVAEAAASRAAHESTARALDVLGPRAASARLGLDRFWRNARTHTLHEPAAHRFREVGDYFLNGAHPAFSLPV